MFAIAQIKAYFGLSFYLPNYCIFYSKSSLSFIICNKVTLACIVYLSYLQVN